MTEQQKKEALDYIEAQLEYGYIDLGAHDECELEIIKEAINTWKTIDKINSVGLMGFQVNADDRAYHMFESNEIECED